MGWQTRDKKRQGCLIIDEFVPLFVSSFVPFLSIFVSSLFFHIGFMKNLVFALSSSRKRRGERYSAARIARKLPTI